MEGFSWQHLSEADHPDVLRAVHDWWGPDGGGPARASLLPRLFFQHVGPTSAVVRDGHGLAGFLVGLLSRTDPELAYIHFVAVRPDLRGEDLGRALYERSSAAVREHGRAVVRAVTSPGNTGSQAFHRRMGFEVGAPVVDYDGPGLDRVCFVRRLTSDGAAGEG